MSNSGHHNSGHRNSGHHNSGNFNSGNYNSGHHNSGHHNSGNENSGHRNSGHHNSGNENSGYRNSGNENSGNFNSGNFNSGDYNSGHHNSGHHNSGNDNSGNFNSGNYNSGDCNTNNPTVRLFNKDSGLEYNGSLHDKFRATIFRYQKFLCTWVYKKDMSDQEKKDNPSYKTTGGYLKVNDSTYNGKEVSKEDRDFLESMPNFCPKILEECTGIVFNTDKILTIDGKDIKISKESFEQLKKQLLD